MRDGRSLTRTAPPSSGSGGEGIEKSANKALFLPSALTEMVSMASPPTSRMCTKMGGFYGQDEGISGFVGERYAAWRRIVIRVGGRFPCWPSSAEADGKVTNPFIGHPWSNARVIIESEWEVVSATPGYRPDR